MSTDCIVRTGILVFPETPESADFCYHFHVVLIIYINHVTATCNN